MKYLRRQVLDRSRVTGNLSGASGSAGAYSTVYTDIGGEVIVGSVYNLLVPKGPSSTRSPDNTTFVDGMIRYNSTTGEFEGRQAGSWRSFRFKEPTAISLQTLSEVGDGSTVIFGPLTPDPFSYTVQSGVTWDAAQIAQNLLVLVENVVQIPGVNFTIIQNPAGNYGGNPGVDMPNGTYIQFSTAVPANKPVYVFHNLDR
jgi:hypothetical protein